MCKDLQKNNIYKMKFHEEINQFIEQFKGQIIGQHFQYLLKNYVHESRWTLSQNYKLW